MATLRITQFSDAQPDHYRAEVALEGDGARQTATVQFQFKLTPQEQENIRWYLEDYLQYLSDPAPQIAAKVEQRMAAIGVELFKAIFQANDDARDLWATLRQNLNNTRVEILTDIAQATTIPWELLRDPKTDICLSLRSPAFVRSYSQAAQRPRLPQADGDAIRILLVICRPRGRADVPFRSVASRLIKGLGDKPDGFQLDVLRPPTFEQLSRVLRQAKVQGKPYHVVHFDGHGVYQDGSQLMLSGNPLVFFDRRPGMHGYLAFENGLAADNVEFVSGSDLGRLLVETDVPVLVLNACRSAHSETQDAPTQVNDTAPDQLNDPHSQVRAFGSLAQEVMDTGVAGVVAMRYNVYVITAAQFVANLYASLVQGQTLGEAVTSGRKQLKDQPQREVAYKPVTLQDWVVPVVYEAAAIALFPTPTNTPTLTITLYENDALPMTGMLDAQLPKTPDVGFFGRDETLLAIDRAFDNHAIVLLHAFAGSGKTSTAAEFGRWYALTGGLLEAGKQGFVLFTSFQRYLPLSRVLDKLGQVFERDLAQSGIHWLALSDDQRRAVALQVLSQVSVLWFWDNVEPVAGFPDGETQCWDEAEQQELADFLRDARNTKAKFLLTSRRDERAWLGDLPTRVQVPPMPMQERVQFARELAKKHGYRLTDIGNWFPLLKYTQGNPLTITIIVGQALRNGYRSKEQIEKFVSDLRSGEAELDDDESEGKSKSLSASLSYGLLHEFNDEELEKLALLHLFQGFLNIATLGLMGHENPLLGGCLKCISDLSRENWLHLFDRAAKIGLLTNIGPGLYELHPVIAWYFKKLFDKYHLNLESSASEGFQNKDTRLFSKRLPQATYAFIHALSLLGVVYHYHWAHGDYSAVWMLLDEEANFLYAYRLAKERELWFQVINILQGIHALYSHTGRWTEWIHLIDNILPNFIDLRTDRCLQNHQDSWSIITEFRVEIFSRQYCWTKAEHLQSLRVDWNRKRVGNAINLPLESLKPEQINTIQTLAGALNGLGTILREQSKANCVGTYEESYKLNLHIKDNWGAAISAYNLGHTYFEISEFRNLEQAKYWYKSSLNLRSETDFLGQSKCWSQLGRVAYEYCIEVISENLSETTFLASLNESIEYSLKSLEMLPSDALDDLAITYGQLGLIHRLGGNSELALLSFRKSIHFEELQGNFYGAATMLRNISVLLAELNRFDEALLYAESSLQKYETYGNGSVGEIEKTLNLISMLKKSVSRAEERASQ